jgi:hypothetical protein
MRTITCGIVIILVCLFSPAAHLQGNGINPFRKFVKALPPVNKVEVIAVTPVVTDEVERSDCARPGFVCAPYTFPYEIGTVKTLIGDDAYRISAQWRKLERDSNNDDKCLVPDHILRFYHDDKLLLESQVCALCRKITLPIMGVVSVAGSNEAPYYHFQNSLIPDSDWTQSLDNFKRKMLPKVGQQFTINGLLLEGKPGMAVAYDDGEIYLKGVNLARTNELMNLGCHTAIKVTGTLRHFPEPPPQPPPQHGRKTSGLLPEHFYFQNASVQVLRVEKSSSPKRKKSR